MVTKIETLPTKRITIRTDATYIEFLGKTGSQIEVRVCELCGSMLGDEFIATHLDWHNQHG